eukprot:scaffold1741_cov262-Pinguiococcus_pyrenoidosus.AAC.19
MLKKIEDAGGTYTFLKSSYPYLASPDEGLRFLANIILVVEELVPVLVNLEAATTGSEWFNRDNLRILTEACHSLRELVQVDHRTLHPEWRRRDGLTRVVFRQSLNDPTKQPHPERFRERSPRNPFYSSAARKKLLSGAYALLLGEVSSLRPSESNPSCGPSAVGCAGTGRCRLFDNQGQELDRISCVRQGVFWNEERLRHGDAATWADRRGHARSLRSRPSTTGDKAVGADPPSSIVAHFGTRFADE